MGQVLNCQCLEVVTAAASSGDAEKAKKTRLESLQKGNSFLRSAYLGLSSQELFVTLSQDTSSLQWKTVNAWQPAHDTIDLTTVKTVKIHGLQGLQLLASADGASSSSSGSSSSNSSSSSSSSSTTTTTTTTTKDKVIFEVTADCVETRDKWVCALNELLQDWTTNPINMPKANLSADSTSNKAAYFKKREEELAAREKANAEKRTKYAAGGMKYTAIAMAERS